MLYTMFVCLGVAFIEALGVVEICKLNIDAKALGISVVGLTAVCLVVLVFWFLNVEANKDKDD